MALGNPDRGDDGAALLVAERFEEEASVVLAGRPGPGLLDLLSPGRPCLLLDVTFSGTAPGTLHQFPLQGIRPGLLPDARVSSHGFGPGEAFALARTLGRQLPPGYFIGIEGRSFEMGAGLSPEVAEALPRLEEQVRGTLLALREGAGLHDEAR